MKSLAIILALLIQLWPLQGIGAARPPQLQKFLKNLAPEKRKLSNLRAVAEELRQDFLKERMKELLKVARPNRVPGSSGHEQARNFILQEFARMGRETGVALTPRVEIFTPDVEWAIAQYQADFEREVASRLKPGQADYVKWQQFTRDISQKLKALAKVQGHNIVLELKGSKRPEDVLIVAANIDSILMDQNLRVSFEGNMPAADDNASGVIGVLALAQLLSQLELEKSVWLVLFDYQELASMGARAFLAQHQARLKQGQSAMINLLMLGHDSSQKDKMKKTGNMKAYLRSPTQAGGDEDRALFELFARANKSSAQGQVFSSMASGLDHSDHALFWQAGLPAVLFTQDWDNDPDPRQHTSNDFAETLNFSTYLRTLKYLAVGILSWSSIAPITK